MDFDDTPEDAAFRAESGCGWPTTSASCQVDPDRGGESLIFADVEDTDYVSCREQGVAEGAVRRRLMPILGWPVGYGGVSSHRTRVVWGQERRRRSAPPTINVIGEGMAGLMIAHGTENRSEAYAEPLLRGERISSTASLRPAPMILNSHAAATATRMGD